MDLGLVLLLEVVVDRMIGLDARVFRYRRCIVCSKFPDIDVSSGVRVDGFDIADF